MNIKTNEEILNILKQSTSFNNCRNMCDILGFKYNTNHPSTNLNTLSRYCVWHKVNNNIIIDTVFDKVLPDRRDFLYEINQIIENKTGTFVILNRYRKMYDSHKDKHTYKTYLCKCLKDDFKFELKESHIKQGVGCPKCGGRKAILGYNTIYDLRKDLLQYIVNAEDAKQYTVFSSKQILCQCPICGCQKLVAINNLSQAGFSCPYCSDGISYPNKFIRELLNQLKINYIPEKRFEWSNGKIYDFFLVDYNCIIEANGLQHYSETTFTTRTLEEEQQNDKYKMTMAINHSIKNYIVLDCRESNVSFIKNSIINSDLFKVLSINNPTINWLECDKSATKSIIEDICYAWTENHNITDLAKQFKLDPHTIISYLEKGCLFGLCDYVKGNREHMKDITRDVHSKPILCKELNVLFYSKRECEEYFKNNGYLNFKGDYLYNYINKNQKYKNYTFQYIDKAVYNSIKREVDNNSSLYKVYGKYYTKGF